MTGDDGGYVRFRAPHLGSGLRRKDEGGSEMTGVACGSTPRTWVPAFAGKTVGGVGDDGDVVRFHAPHLGSCLRRKDGGGGRS